MILVAVGTHEDPFDRLIRAAEEIARTGVEDVVLQRGTSTYPAPSCTGFDLLPPRQFDQWMARARVVVTHAGPATIDLALGYGKIPIVVPRSPRFGEHVDDHQVQFVERLRERIHVVDDPADLPAAIARHPEIEDRLRARKGATAPVGWSGGEKELRAARFGGIVDELVRTRRNAWGVRATLAKLFRRVHRR